MNGIFITFEGVDGAGKSTQLRLVAERLRQLGYPVCCTREPGGTEIGDQIRRILHDVNNTEMTAEAEILLYSASRAQLVRQFVLPTLERGEVVLCDRYVESTYAYQGYGRQLDFDMLRSLTEFATQGLKPHLIIYLDLDIREGLRRKVEAQSTGRDELNRMDQLEQAFYQRVRQGYLEMAQIDPARWFVVDATAPANEVSQIICRQVEKMLLPGH
jgi:dTMP kinase